ncbi:uncharacterized protein LOC107647637 [Arachis ipaensis]|uniref:uncharacterized protein LOC107647637 n=1 Tax=Arachis ipaensis TaxID=130454 RepID=UPI000A2B3824|nr:uncharacterized protein LOC107647637 [Arachis ipaensis]
MSARPLCAFSARPPRAASFNQPVLATCPPRPLCDVTPPPPQESYSAPPSVALRHHCVSVRSSAAPRVFLYPKTQPKLTVISPTAARSETQRCRRICSKPPPSPLGSSTPLLEGVVPTATRCVVPPSPSRCSAAPALFHRAPPLLFSGSAALHPPLLHSVRSTLRCSKIPLPHILPLLRIVNIKLPPASARHVLAPSPSYSARSKTTEGSNFIGSIQVLPQHHYRCHYLCFLLNLNLPISNLKPPIISSKSQSFPFSTTTPLLHFFFTSYDVNVSASKKLAQCLFEPICRSTTFLSQFQETHLHPHPNDTLGPPLPHHGVSKPAVSKWNSYTLDQALSFVAKNGTVIVCIVSQPYLPFLNNWLISITRQNRQDMVLVIAYEFGWKLGLSGILYASQTTTSGSNFTRGKKNDIV